MKKCSKCQEIKSVKDFYKNKAKKDGLTTECKACSKANYEIQKVKHKDRIKRRKIEYHKENAEKICKKSATWYANNKERAAKTNRKNRLKKYGLTFESFEKLLAKQNEKCAICFSPFESDYGRHIDHCHTTEKVRGVLCGPCNQALGLFKENTQTLKNAVKYLNKHKKELK